jgi:hypothetical protein
MQVGSNLLIRKNPTDVGHNQATLALIENIIHLMIDDNFKVIFYGSYQLEKVQGVNLLKLIKFCGQGPF